MCHGVGDGSAPDGSRAWVRPGWNQLSLPEMMLGAAASQTLLVKQSLMV